jgi:hypothetical protein
MFLLTRQACPEYEIASPRLQWRPAVKRPSSVVARSPALAGRRSRLDFIIEERQILKFEFEEACEEVMFQKRSRET